MTVDELKKDLVLRISEQEADALRRGTESFYISPFNRDVCLRLLDDAKTDRSLVFEAKVRELESELTDYLNEYMQDKPEGHKWIIIACLYLTFAEHLPMHPQAAAKWTERDGRFFCPNMVPESITCGYCMCERMDNGQADS